MKDYFNPTGKLDEDIFLLEDDDGNDFEEFILLKCPKTIQFFRVSSTTRRRCRGVLGLG